MPIPPNRAARVGPVTPPPATGIARCRELAERGLARMEALEPLLNPWVEPNEPACWKRADQVNASVATTATLFSVIRDAANKVVDGPQAEKAKEIAQLCTRAERYDSSLGERLPEEKIQRHLIQYVGIVGERRHNAEIFLKDILARCNP